MEECTQWICATTGEVKVHKNMCAQLSKVLNASIQVFPSLEAIRPGCRSGIQALSALHLALEKAKGLIQYCATSSKLYLAMTGDSILLKFSRVSADLDNNLSQIAEVASGSLSKKIAEVRKEVGQAKYFLDPLDKQLGARIISLLLKEKDGQSGEEVMFQQIATDLGLVSIKSVLEERHALKILHEKAESADDKKKASILLYFLHHLKKHSKTIKNNSSNSFFAEQDKLVQKGVARSYTLPAGNEVSKHKSKLDLTSTRDVPEQFKCPLSLQLMSDPVIIASGQTYERTCIESWFQQGNNTCPKTMQSLSNLSVTQNTCVKNLIALWCKNNDRPAPEMTPSPSLSTLSWNSMSSSSFGSSLGVEEYLRSIGDSSLGSFSGDGIISQQDGRSCEVDDGEAGASTLPTGVSRTEASCIAFENENEQRRAKLNQDGSIQNLENFVQGLSCQDWEVQCNSAKGLQILIRDAPNALRYITDDSVILLVKFLGRALSCRDTSLQEVGILILLDLSIFDRENEERIVNAGVLPILIRLLKESSELTVKEVALSLLMILSCTEKNREQIGLAGAIPMLVSFLDKKPCLNLSDALVTLCNLSTVLENQRQIIQTSAVQKLVNLLKSRDKNIREKCLLIMYHIASVEEGRCMLMETQGCLATIIDHLKSGTNEEQGHASAISLLLCKHSFVINNLFRQEGVMPFLLSWSKEVNA